MRPIDVIALVLGTVIALVVAVLAAGVVDSGDKSMRWEAGVAVGFTGFIVIGPFWIAQGVLTIMATVDDGGVSAAWLWAWLFLAPAIGVSPPGVGVARVLRRVFS